MRLVLTLVLVGFAYAPRRAWLGFLSAPAAVGLLATFGAISHNASMPGRLPVPADLVHLIAAVAWTGTVLAVALLAKVALVLAIVGLAARNRWQFLPGLRRNGPSAALARALRIEAVLLLVVIGAPGWVTTSPMPH